MGVPDRRQRDRERRRQEILSAAVEVFAERGLEGASMGAIAGRAELGKATLYYYFATKEELFSAVVAEGTERFFASLGSVGGSFEELSGLVEAVLRAYVGFFTEHPELLRVTAPYLSHVHWGHGGAAGEPVAAPEGHPAIPGGPPPMPRAEIPAHLSFLTELDRLLVESPWAERRGVFVGFLADVFVALAQRVMAGQVAEIEEQVAFYVDLVRGYRTEAND